MFKQKKYIIPAAAILAVAIILLVVFKLKPNSGKYYKVKRGNLEVVVNSKGEINGEKYTEINLPEEVCDENLRVYQIKILDAILEGKEVKKGDYVAKLDEGMFANMMQDVMKQKEMVDADLNNAVIDSAVNLNAKREDITNALLDLEYNKIDLEQSKFESQAYQRKTQMQYQKAEINVEKLRRDYLLEKNRMKMRVSRFQDRASEFQRRIDKYRQAIAATTVKAPEDGIVMFAKDWSGKSYGKDSEIIIWRPLLATLPDMSTVTTETYIREIDISKIHLNDSVRITIEALPDRVFWGKVTYIATIGEDHKDFDMKAFKVIIRLDKNDKDMKPGMSSNNDIIIASYSDRLLVPLKAIFTRNGKQVVYVKNGANIEQTEVQSVAQNDEFAAIDKNIQEGELILLYQPEEFRQLSAAK